MAITKETRDYEILVRVNEDGRIGAHRQTITEIKEDGQLLSASLNAPEELDFDGVQSALSALFDAEWLLTKVAE